MVGSGCVSAYMVAPAFVCGHGEVTPPQPRAGCCQHAVRTAGRGRQSTKNSLRGARRAEADSGVSGSLRYCALRPAGRGFGLWRSLVAHLTGGQGVAGSNPVSPTERDRRSEAVFPLGEAASWLSSGPCDTSVDTTWPRNRANTGRPGSHPRNVHDVGKDDGLGPEDALCLRIGRVARTHVTFDQYLRAVHQLLMSPGLGAFLTNSITSSERLVEDCRKMLSKADTEPRVSERGCWRSRRPAGPTIFVVHDMWVRDVESDSAEPPRWNVLKHQKGGLGAHNTESPRDLQSVNEAKTEIDRTAIRVLALYEALAGTLPHWKDSGRGPGFLWGRRSTGGSRSWRTGSMSWKPALSAYTVKCPRSKVQLAPPPTPRSGMCAAYSVVPVRRLQLRL